MKKLMIIIALICATALVLWYGVSRYNTASEQAECKYIVTDADYEYIIKPLVLNSYLCESMRNALNEYNPELCKNALNPEHGYCFTCKVRALKFFYESDDWADTAGEMWEAEDLETLLQTNPKFKALWDSIEF